MTPTNPRQRKRRAIGLIALALVGLGVAAFCYWRPANSPIPVINTEGLDTEVVATIEEARSEVSQHPADADAWGNLGMVLFAHDRYADSVPVLEQAERLGPNDVRWPYLRGMALMFDHPEEGISALQKASAMSPHSANVRLRLAEQLLRLDRVDEAEPIFRELLSAPEHGARAKLGLGLISARREHWPEALTPLEEAANYATSRRAAHVALATVQMRLGNLAAAEKELTLASQVGEDTVWPDPYLARAQALRTGLQPRIGATTRLLSEGKLDQASNLIAQVLKDHPESDEAHLTYARVLIRANNIDEAEKELRWATGRNPTLADGFFLLGIIEMLRKRFDEAEKNYQRAIELKPTHAGAWHKLGDCRVKRGNRPGAEEAFRAAVRIRPDLALAHQELAALLLEDGKREEAVAQLEDALRIDATLLRSSELLEQARRKDPK